MSRSATIDEIRVMPPPNHGERDGALLLVRVQAAMLEHSDFEAAAAACVTEIAVALGAHRVTLGMVEGGFAKVVAVSHGVDSKFGGELFTDIAAAMDECVEQRRGLFYPEFDEGALPAIVLAHRRLAGHLSGTVASQPVQVAGEVIGAVCIEWSADAVCDRGALNHLFGVLALLAPVLKMMRRESMSLRQRLTESAARGRKAFVSPAGRKLRLGLAAGLALLLALTLLPIDYNVSGRARVEGAIERVLVAPNDGFLERTHVRPGDQVHAGQLLVELADQDLQVEHRRWSSELAQYENAYMAALARADRGEMMVQMARAEEAGAKVQLTERALGRVRIEAPFDAVVIAGDLTRSLGAPVKRGESMITLAPVGRYRVIVQLTERDAGLVKRGQQGALALSALPWDTLPVRVERVTPMATVADGENVFEVELGLDGASDGLRPGLHGVAKLTVGRKALLPAWGGRIGDWLRLQWWRWGG